MFSEATLKRLSTDKPLALEFPIKIEFRIVGFWGTRKTGVRKRTNSKFNPLMTPAPGFEPRSHWWEASTLTTSHPCSPSVLTVRLSSGSGICSLFNPLTPEPAVSGRDEPRPFFHFWRHPFGPKLASSILNLRRRKTSFQWCPDQGDWPNGARDMHKNAQKSEWKTRSKISCHYTWLLHGKNCPSRWHFLRSFLTPSKPSRRSITSAKRKEKEKKERRKKNFKNRKA